MRTAKNGASASDGQRIKDVGRDVVAHVEIGRSAEFPRIKNVLNGSALLARPGFGGGAIIDRVRPGVVEIEGEAAGQSATQRKGKRVESGGSGVHPSGHRTALQWEEGVTTVGGDLAAAHEVGSSVPGGARIAIDGMQAVEIAAPVIVVDTAEVIRRGAAGEIEVGKSGPHVFDERQGRHRS